MNVNLAAQRRVLLLTYRRFLEADRDWTAAIRDARQWFPASPVSASPLAIGSPRSRIRRLYEQREKALHQLGVARIKLQEAKARLRRPSVLVRGELLMLTLE